jgi:LemA protein
MSTGWIVIGVIAIPTLRFSAYVCLVALSQRVGQALPTRCAAQAAPRFDPEPGRDREGLRRMSAVRWTTVKARNSAMSAQGPAQVSPPRTS